MPLIHNTPISVKALNLAVDDDLDMAGHLLKANHISESTAAHGVVIDDDLSLSGNDLTEVLGGYMYPAYYTASAAVLQNEIAMDYTILLGVAWQNLFTFGFPQMVSPSPFVVAFHLDSDMNNWPVYVRALVNGTQQGATVTELWQIGANHTINLTAAGTGDTVTIQGAGNGTFGGKLRNPCNLCGTLSGTKNPASLGGYTARPIIW